MTNDRLNKLEDDVQSIKSFLSTNSSSKQFSQFSNSLNSSLGMNNETYEGIHVMQLEKDTFKLRRDLQDAIAGKQQAESRILA